MITSTSGHKLLSVTFLNGGPPPLAFSIPTKDHRWTNYALQEEPLRGTHLIIVVIVFVPFAIQHFMEPLSNCLLADICNHTWIPECGNQTKDDFRMFIDECDMYEYNCDKNKNYSITNYSECFRPFTGCPTLKSFYRIGNYKYLLEGRQIVYAPTERTRIVMRTILRATLATRPYLTFPTSPHGKRRYTPEVAKLRRAAARRTMTTKKDWTTQRVLTTKIWRPTTLLRTVVLKKILMEKNGKKYYKIIKGYDTATTRKYDSDFLE